VHPATSSPSTRRHATASATARTARREVIRESIEYPTMRRESMSLMAHRYNLPSPVQCSVMSASHNSLGPLAVNLRRTRSSCIGGQGRLPFLLRRLAKALHQPLSEQIRHAVLAAMT
jgi:hypothetical protein